MIWEERDGSAYRYWTVPSPHINQFITKQDPHYCTSGYGRSRETGKRIWYWKLTRSYAAAVTRLAFPYHAATIARDEQLPGEYYLKIQQLKGNLSGDPYCLVNGWLLDLQPWHSWFLRFSNPADSVWWQLTHTE